MVVDVTANHHCTWYLKMLCTSILLNHHCVIQGRPFHLHFQLRKVREGTLTLDGRTEAGT